MLTVPVTSGWPCMRASRAWSAADRTRASLSYTNRTSAGTMSLGSARRGDVSTRVCRAACVACVAREVVRTEVRKERGGLEPQGELGVVESLQQVVGQSLAELSAAPTAALRELGVDLEHLHQDRERVAPLRLVRRVQPAKDVLQNALGVAAPNHHTPSSLNACACGRACGVCCGACAVVRVCIRSGVFSDEPDDGGGYAVLALQQKQQARSDPAQFLAAHLQYQHRPTTPDCLVSAFRRRMKNEE
jgi:hypothetical protein